MRFETGFNGACLFRRFFNILYNAEKDIFTSMFFETVQIKSDHERSFRNSVSECLE